MVDGKHPLFLSLATLRAIPIIHNCFDSGGDSCGSLRDPADAGGELAEAHPAMPVIIVGEEGMAGRS